MSHYFRGLNRSTLCPPTIVKFLICLSLGTLGLSPTALNAQDLIVYDSLTSTIDLREGALLATSDELSPEVLLNESLYVPFDRSQLKATKFHILKIRVKNPYNSKRTLYINGFTSDYLMIYESEPNGVIQQPSVNGYLVPLADRTLDNSVLALAPLYLRAHSDKTYFLVMEQKKPNKSLPGSAFSSGFVAYDYDKYTLMNVLKYFSMQFLIGVIIMVIVYNLALGISLKDKTILTLAFYGVMYLIWVGLSSHLLVRLNIAHDLQAIKIVNYIVLPTTLTLGFGLFCYQFGNLKIYAPILGKILLTVLILHTFFHLIKFSSELRPYFDFVSRIFTLLVYFICLFAAINAVRKKVPFAIYFLLTTIVMITGLSIYYAGFYVPSVNFIIADLVYGATIFIKIMILTIAISNRVLIMRKLTIQLRYRNEQMQKEIMQKNSVLLSVETNKFNHGEGLRKIKDDLEKHNQNGNKSQAVSQAIKDLGRLLKFDATWDSYKMAFESVYPGFFDKLQSINNSLTTNDMRLSAYLIMGLKSKEIAGILGVSSAAVDKARQRLKKKLFLEKQTPLVHFLRQLENDRTQALSAE